MIGTLFVIYILGFLGMTIYGARAFRGNGEDTFFVAVIWPIVAPFLLIEGLGVLYIKFHDWIASL